MKLTQLLPGHFHKNVLSYLLGKYLKLTVQNLTKLNLWDAGSIINIIIKIIKEIHVLIFYRIENFLKVPIPSQYTGLDLYHLNHTHCLTHRKMNHTKKSIF